MAAVKDEKVHIVVLDDDLTDGLDLDVSGSHDRDDVQKDVHDIASRNFKDDLRLQLISLCKVIITRLPSNTVTQDIVEMNPLRHKQEINGEVIRNVIGVDVADRKRKALCVSFVKQVDNYAELAFSNVQ